jgi:hypothetical protein
LRELNDKDWGVYAKRPFAEPQQVIDYLGRYTHRIAISNHRLIDLIDDYTCASTGTITPPEINARS